jgi:hypothetical protein
MNHRPCRRPEWALRGWRLPPGRPITQHRPQAPRGSGAQWLVGEWGRQDSIDFLLPHFWFIPYEEAEDGS